MLDNWVFIIGATLMIIADLLCLNVIRLQLKLFIVKSALQPLKKLLLAAVIFLIVGSLPLLYVYLNIVWFHQQSVWIVYVAVLSNATVKVIVAFILNAVYRFRMNGAEL